MNKKDIYIVESPLQIICACESILRRKSDYDLYIRLTRKGDNDKQSLECARNLNIKYKVFTLSPERVFFDSILNFLLFIRIITAGCNGLFLGSIFSKYLKVLSFFARRKTLIYLDDGASTLRAYSLMKNNLMPKVNMFTFYNLEWFLNTKTEIHNFELLRESLSYKKSEKSYFIGQPYQNMLGFTKEEYLKAILKIVKNYSANEDLIYIPHRMENLDILKNIKGITILKIDIPIELYFLFKSKTDPKKIYSCYSSALTTLKLFYPESELYSIESEQGVHKELQAVYEYYNQLGIKSLK